MVLTSPRLMTAYFKRALTLRSVLLCLVIVHTFILLFRWFGLYAHDDIARKRLHTVLDTHFMLEITGHQKKSNSICHPFGQSATLPSSHYAPANCPIRFNGECAACVDECSFPERPTTIKRLNGRGGDCVHICTWIRVHALLVSFVANALKSSENCLALKHVHAVFLLLARHKRESCARSLYDTARGHTAKSDMNGRNGRQCALARLRESYFRS